MLNLEFLCSFRCFSDHSFIRSQVDLRVYKEKGKQNRMRTAIVPAAIISCDTDYHKRQKPPVSAFVLCKWLNSDLEWYLAIFSNRQENPIQTFKDLIFSCCVISTEPKVLQVLSQGFYVQWDGKLWWASMENTLSSFWYFFSVTMADHNIPWRIQIQIHSLNNSFNPRTWGHSFGLLLRQHMALQYAEINSIWKKKVMYNNCGRVWGREDRGIIRERESSLSLLNTSTIKIILAVQLAVCLLWYWPVAGTGRMQEWNRYGNICLA